MPLLLAGPLWHSSAGVERSKNIPPRYAIRLEDLRAWHVIFATCAACGRRIHIDARLLQHGRPPYTWLLVALICLSPACRLTGRRASRARQALFDEAKRRRRRVQVS